MEYNYQVIYTAQFESDLDCIANYFCNTLMNPDAYLRLISKIEQKENMLKTFPKSFSGFDSEISLKYFYRTFHVGNYMVFFYIDEDEHIVYVQRILYSRMDLENIEI